MDLVEDSADQVDSFEDLEADAESSPYTIDDDNSDNGSVQEASDTFASEGAPDPLDVNIGPDKEDSDPAWSSTDILSLRSFHEEELQQPSGNFTPDKDLVHFISNLSLESGDEFAHSFQEDSAFNSADRAFTTRTHSVQTDDVGHLCAFSNEDLLSLSSDGAPGKDASYNEPSLNSRNTVTSSPDGSADASSVSSSSSNRGRKILKRIRKFFRRVAEAFSCCCCVED